MANLDQLLADVKAGKISLDQAKAQLVEVASGKAFQVSQSSAHVTKTGSIPMLYFTGNFKPKKLSANFARAICDNSAEVIAACDVAMANAKASDK